MEIDVDGEIRIVPGGAEVDPQLHAVLCRLGSDGPFKSRRALAEAVGCSVDTVNELVKDAFAVLNPNKECADSRGRGAICLTDRGARYLNETEEMGLSPDEYRHHRQRWFSFAGEWRERGPGRTVG